jgi:hypothetical protein
MATQQQIEDAVLNCLRHVPFENLTLDAPFDDFWQRVEEQDERTNRGIHRVDLFIKCLRDALQSGVLINRDMLLQGRISTPRDIVEIILD